MTKRKDMDRISHSTKRSKVIYCFIEKIISTSHCKNCWVQRNRNYYYGSCSKCQGKF